MIRSLLLIAFLFVGFSANSVFADEPSDHLIQMIGAWETRGKLDPDQAVGDKHLKDKAYGWLQIRQPAVDDFNSRHGTNYKAQDCLGNRSLSIVICRWYIGNYATERRIGRKPTDEDKARIWNGGPNGWKKKSTVDYYFDVVNHWKSLKKS